MTGEKMKAAYGAARRIFESNQSAEDQAVIEDVTGDDIVVVPGQYDHVEDVLKIMELPHKVVQPGQVGRLNLTPDQMLVVDCPGILDGGAIQKVRDFVESGGSLFTTDWALKHVLEKAFPGIVEFNQQATPDAVVRVTRKSTDNPMLDELFEEGSDPQWWLEGSSYPIKILAPDRWKSWLRVASLVKNGVKAR